MTREGYCIQCGVTVETHPERSGSVMLWHCHQCGGVCNRTEASESLNAERDRLRAEVEQLRAACMEAADLLGRIPEIPNYEGWSLSVMLKCMEAAKAAGGGE